MNAKFTCTSCKFSWESPPRPTICPKCGVVKVEWTNWEEIVERTRQKTTETREKEASRPPFRAPSE